MPIRASQCIFHYESAIQPMPDAPAGYTNTPVLDAVLGASPGQPALEYLLAVDLLLHGAAGDEAVHEHVARLANAVGPVHTLKGTNKKKQTFGMCSYL